MASFRIIAALTVVTGAWVFAAMPTASAQTARIQAAPAVGAAPGFSRCPKSAEQYSTVVSQLVRSVEHARAAADVNPLLEPDAAFYEAELAATKQCGATVAALRPAR
jgi:hypothetical protein